MNKEKKTEEECIAGEKDFYITCFSRSAAADGPPGNFKFDLDKKLDLCKPGYKIGLSEITFFTCFYNVTKNCPIILTCNKSKNFDPILNKRSKESDTDPVQIDAGWYPTTKDLIETINREINKLDNIFQVWHHTYNRLPRFHYHEESGRVHYFPGVINKYYKINIVLNEELLKLLEFDPIEGTNSERIISNYSVDLQRHFHKLHVYTPGLIKEQSFCETTQALIKTLELPNPFKYGDKITFKPNKIQYFDYQWTPEDPKKSLEERRDQNTVFHITVKLKNEDFKLINFEDGYTTAKLHFKNDII